MNSRRNLIDDWKRLTGFEVDVFKAGRLVRSGTVAEASPDSHLMWIAADGVDGRMLVHRKEGYTVGIDDEQLARLQMRQGESSAVVRSRHASRR